MRRKKLTLPLLFSIALLALAFGANVGASSSVKKEVTFSKDVAPILFKACVECHRAGEAAPMSLLTYKEARPWARSIKEKVATREMPPWHADPAHGTFSNDRRLTQEQINTITAWVDQGAKEGNPKDMPAAPQFADGWNIGKPDVVLSMSEEFTLDAEGPDEYQYFEIQTNFKEDKYVQMAEARPGNRKIVHHIIAFIQPPPKGGGPQRKYTKEEFEQFRAEMAAQGRRVGIGLACYVEGTGVGPYEGAHVHIETSGKVKVATGLTTQGQGHQTAFAQIVADTLGVRFEDVEITTGDTRKMPYAVGTFASRAAVMSGSAIHLAALRAKEKALRIAAEALEAAEDDLEIADGVVTVKGTDASIDLGTVAVLSNPLRYAFDEASKAATQFSVGD
ncbi:MAG TPA: molybdopterin cofactor-binding domain-containing protein, partial [Blastocatellia bacterium]